MSDIKMDTITDAFLGENVRNTIWNMASGTYGFDPETDLTFVEAATIPSYLGASLYDATNSSFSLRIIPAEGSLQQTAVIIQASTSDYVQMHVGPLGQFRGFLSANKEIFIPDTPFPAYDPDVHVFWRIRDEEGTTFFFETSTDGETWTELGRIGYPWLSDNVSVLVVAGSIEDGEEGIHRVYFGDVNLRPSQFAMSATVFSQSNGSGELRNTEPQTLSAIGFAQSGAVGTTGPVVQIIRGGITDLGFADWLQPDPARSRVLGGLSTNVNNTTTGRPWLSATAPGVYRDGSYWKPARYAAVAGNWTNIPDTTYQYFMNVQLEENNNFGNRLGLDGASYQERCMYQPQSSAGLGGSSQVIRSVTRAYSGKNSGRMFFPGLTGSPRTITSGLQVYFPYASKGAQAPVKQGETIRGSVYVSADRPGLQWFPAVVQFNDAGVIVTATYNNPTITHMLTHPGDSTWQQGTYTVPVAVGTTRAAIIPVVIWSGVAENEFIWMDNHFITGITPNVSNSPSTFEAPREANIKVRADRVNHIFNGGMNANITGWGRFQFGTTGDLNQLYTTNWDATVGYKSLGSLRVDVTQPGGGFTATPTARFGPGTFRVWNGALPQIQGLKIGVRYNFSAWIKKGPGCPDMRMQFYDTNGVGYTGTGLTYSFTANGDQPHNVDGEWVRLEQSLVIPSGALPDFHIWINQAVADVAATAPYSYWVDSVMVTESFDPVDFFDGNFSSGDYLWEGIVNQSRSHYYQDLTHKRERVDAVVRENLPLGAKYEIIYASDPT